MDEDGNVLVAGYTESNSLDGQHSAGSADVFLMNFSNTGVHQWTTLHGGGAVDQTGSLGCLQAEARVDEFSGCLFSCLLSETGSSVIGRQSAVSIHRILGMSRNA